MNKQSMLPRHIKILETYITDTISLTPNPYASTAEACGTSATTVQKIVLKSKEYIQEALKDYFKSLNQDRVRVYEELKNIAFSNIKDIANVTENDVEFSDWREMDEKILAQVKEVSSTTTRYGTNLKIQMYDKMQALSQLVKVLQMSEEIHHVKGTIDIGTKLFDGIMEDDDVTDKLMEQINPN